MRSGIYDYIENELICRYINERYWEMIGREKCDLSSISVLEFVQSEDRAYLLRIIRQGILHGGKMECDIHILHGNGRYIPFHLTGNSVRQDKEKLTIYVIYMPIPEQELPFREMLPVALKTMMASSTDLSFIKDRTLTYVCATRAFARMAGFSDEEEIIGKTDYELFDKALAEQFREDDKRVMRTGQPIIDYMERLPDQDGVSHYSSTSKYLLKDAAGNIIGLYGIGRDVTENKEAFERLKLLTDSMPGGLATYEIMPDKVKAVFLSEGVYTLSGYQRGDYGLANHDPLSLVFEEDLPEMQRQLSAFAESGASVDCTYRLYLKEGGYKWINLKGVEAERSENGVLMNAVLFDVTEAQTATLKLKTLERENWKRYEQELQLRKELIRNSVLYYQLTLPRASLKSIVLNIRMSVG